MLFLTTFLSQSALEVVVLTNFRAANDENSVKMTFPFQRFTPVDVMPHATLCEHEESLTCALLSWLTAMLVADALTILWQMQKCKRMRNQGVKNKSKAVG